MTAKRLMIGSAALAIAGLVGVSGAAAFDGHRGGGGGHMGGGGARMGSGFSGGRVASPSRMGASGVVTGRTIATEKRDEIPPLHSITSSARASSSRGTVRPSAFAVLRLITSSTLVPCWMGRSVGLAPLRIFPT